MTLGKSLKVKLKTDANGNPPLPPRIEQNSAKILVNERACEMEEGCVFISKNTFEDFVIAPGSQMAHAASIAVANTPAGRPSNPFEEWEGARRGDVSGNIYSRIHSGHSA
jgi:chromosomal replication initiation ATPase DnaA